MTDLHISDNTVLKWDNNGETYMVHIEQDSMADSPRNWDNVSTMACWCWGHELGDAIEADEPEEFWRQLVRDNVPEKEIFAAAESGKLTGIRFAKNEEDQHLVDIYETSYLRTVFGDSKPSECLEYEGVAPEAVAGCLMEDLTVTHCMTLMELYAEWMPLWLYDHSGLTMSCSKRTGQYADQWDSGPVGWIILEKRKAISELCATEESWREKAIENMTADVTVYGQYLTDEVYGYTLSKLVGNEWEEIDDCWGFYGSGIAESGILDECPGLREAIEAGEYKTGTVRTRTETYYTFD